MSFLVRLSDLAEDAGNELGEFTQQLSLQLRNFACDLWELYPDRITNNNSLGASFSRGYMRSVCAESSPPPPVYTPGCEPRMHIFGTMIGKNLSGGGCDVTGYWRTKQDVIVDDVENTAPTVNQSGEWVILLKNNGESQLTYLSQSLYDNDYLVNFTSNVRIIFVPPEDPCFNQTQPGHGHSLEFDKVVPVPNTNPACVDDGEYPVSSPPDPLERDINVLVGGDTIITRNFTVDLDVNGDIGFPINFTSSDLNVSLDLGGLNFSPNFDNDDGTDNFKPPVVGDNPGGDKTTFLKDPFDPGSFTRYFPNDDEPLPEDLPEEVEEEEVMDGEIVWVLVDITKQPVSGKSVLQNNPSDSTYFAGYFSWTITTPNGTYRMPEEPIRKAKNAFRAPEDAVGYRLYTVNGAKVASTLYKQVVESEGT